MWYMPPFSAVGAHKAGVHALVTLAVVFVTLGLLAWVMVAVASRIARRRGRRGS